MENRWLTPAILAAGLAGSIYVLTKYLDAQPVLKEENRLVRKNAVCNRLDTAYVTDWAQKMQKTYGLSTCYLVSRVTPETMKLFALGSIPEGMDVQKHMILAAVDEEKHLPLEVLLVNFNLLDEELISLMGDEDFFVIKN